MNQAGRRHVIMNFLEFDGPLTLHALSSKCGIDQTTIGRDVAWLERAEIVAKEENPAWRSGAKVSRYIYRLEDAA